MTNLHLIPPPEAITVDLKEFCRMIGKAEAEKALTRDYLTFAARAASDSPFFTGYSDTDIAFFKKVASDALHGKGYQYEDGIYAVLPEKISYSAIKVNQGKETK